MTYKMKNLKSTAKITAQITSVRYVKEKYAYEVEFIGKSDETNCTDEGIAFFPKQELEELICKCGLKNVLDVVGRKLVLKSSNKTENIKTEKTTTDVFSLSDGIYTGLISNIYKLNDETYQLDLRIGKKFLTTFLSTDEVRTYPFSALFRIIDAECMLDLIGHTVKITVKSKVHSGGRKNDFKIVKYDVIS